ncbi:MAG TPA: site-specific integrase [Acidimicrobiales bacterium]|nr:site-specific integrase [Acidimicrobiales bacterium]
MAGSIRQRPDRGANTWELRVFVGRDGSGRVRHRSVTFHGTKRAAERELARLVADQDATPATVPEESLGRWGPTSTINDALAAWQANGWEDLSPSTTRRYESLWDVHIRDDIGRRRIASLSSYDLERWYRELKRRGQGQASVRQARAMLNRACRLARKWSGGALPNPVAESELPTWSLHEKGEPVRSPTLEEVRRLLAEAVSYDLRLAVLLRLVAATGARRGEVCALRWSDVDFAGHCLRFDEAVVAAKGGAIVRGPKTRASIRTIALDEDSLAMLAELRRAQDELARSCERELDDESFVFSFEPGGSTPLYPDTVNHGFRVIRKRAGVASDLHLHSLRHFHATLLDPIVSERQKQARLGWATVHMARHYTDAIEEEDRRAATHVANVLKTGPSRAKSTEPSTLPVASG